MTKLCKDCKHYKKDWSACIIGLEDKFDLCLHPLVTGLIGQQLKVRWPPLMSRSEFADFSSICEQ